MCVQGQSGVVNPNMTSLYPLINIGFLYLDQSEALYVHGAQTSQQRVVCLPANLLIYIEERSLSGGLDYRACDPNSAEFGDLLL